MAEALRKDSVRIGVVGAGIWAAFSQVPAVLANPRAVLAGIADNDPARLAATADHHRVSERYASSRDLIANANLDALVVTTPHATHYDIARDALDAGLHVLIEKPMTVRAADARDLEMRAQAAGLHIVVGYTLNFTHGARAARELVQSGRLGEITLVAGLFTSSLEDILAGFPGSENPYLRVSPIGGPDEGTYADPSRSGGGQGQSQATHALGMLAWVTALRPRRVSALMSNRSAAVDVIDVVAYELDNGALGTLASSGALGHDQAAQQEQVYYGTLGTLHQDLLTGSVTLFPRDGSAPSTISPALPNDDAVSHHAPLDCLVDLILGTGENCAPASVGIAAVELLEAAYESVASGGSAIALP